MRELSMQEIECVSGADIGDAAVAGFIAGGAIGLRTGNPWFAVGGAFIGAAVGMIIYSAATGSALY